VIYITNSNNYKTKPGKISILARLKPSLVFYPKLIKIVIDASAIARKGKYDGNEWVKSSYRTIKAMESAGAIFEINNLDIVKNLDSPCVFLANHMSTLETFALPCLIQPFRQVTYVIKEGLTRYPVFKHVMTARNPIVVTRDNPRADFKTVIKEGIEKLNNGISIIVFPQTTRHIEFNPSQFNSIGIKLALKAKVPVVPVALKTNAWGNGKIIKDFGKIDPSQKIFIEFGEPISVSGNGRDAHKKVIAFIEKHLLDWK